MWQFINNNFVTIIIEFSTWKAELEEVSTSYFVKATGIKADSDGNSIYYYYCNRSGFYSTQSTGKRQIKSQGTSKLNTYCTAFIKTTQHMKTGEIQVQTCTTHYGHLEQLEHIRLPEKIRLSVASQLCQGVSFDHILNMIRMGGSEKQNPIDLMTRKDIRNIEKSYHLNSVQRHKDDATSVACWVKEMAEKKDKSPVLLYKPQGQPQSDKCNNLSDNDFLLCLQTPFQASMLKKFGHGGIVCVDSTHATNAYHFPLVTIVIVDEFGEYIKPGRSVCFGKFLSSYQRENWLYCSNMVYVR